MLCTYCRQPASRSCAVCRAPVCRKHEFHETHVSKVNALAIADGRLQAREATVTRFTASFDGVMDRLEELERENQHLREREAEFEKQRADYHHIVSELSRCERDHDALLHENDALRSKLAGADQRAATYSNELVMALDAGKQIAHERDELQAENATMRLHIAGLLDIADLALYYAPGEIGENFERANGTVIRARAFLASAGQAESE